MADFVANHSAFADLVRQLSDGCTNRLGKSGGNGAHGKRGRLFYSTTGRAVRQSWGAAAVADTPSKHARAAASDPKMRFGTDVFVTPRGPSYANAMRGTSVRTRTAGS